MRAFEIKVYNWKEVSQILCQSVGWFDCTVTRDAKTEHIVLNNAVFRDLNDIEYQTTIIWIFLHRSDV
jgi:hypothetical protein